MGMRGPCSRALCFIFMNGLQKRRAAMPKGFRRPMYCACCVQSNWAHIFAFAPEIETMKMHENHGSGFIEGWLGRKIRL